MERLLKKELAPISGFENQLQYGITIAELARLFSPGSVKKIFEVHKLIIHLIYKNYNKNYNIL